MSGRPELILVSREQEEAAGREGAAQVAESMGIFSDPGLTAYVAAVGGRLALLSPRERMEWRFEIVDQEAPNAFALPDGHIYVSRGLLEIANSEDELAAVLAHEVVHVAARHHAQQETQATGVSLLALPGRLAGLVVGGPLGELAEAPLLLLGSGLVASYGRGQEREADRVGQRLAAEAGYDPAALAAYLTTLERWSAGRDGVRHEPGFFDTHPAAPERAADARARAAALPRRPPAAVAGDRDAFLGRLAGLLVGGNPAEGIVEGTRFVHPDLGFALRFPDGWQVANAHRAVLALAPDRRASLVLELEGRGSDPREAAARTLAATSREIPLEVLRAGALDVGGRRAFRVEAAAGGGGATFLHLTWIAHGGAIYRVAGVADASEARTHRDAFAAASASFGPLAPEELAGIQVRRLRLVRARPAESLAALGQRAGSAWEPAYAAIANGLAPDAVLPEGLLVKVAVAEPYAVPPGSGERTR